VNAYTVAITCEGYNAQMIIKIDDAAGTPRINELWVRPTEGSGLAAEELPNVNFDLLLRSLQQPGIGTGPDAHPHQDVADEASADNVGRGANTGDGSASATISATPARALDPSWTRREPAKREPAKKDTAKKAAGNGAVATRQASGAGERQRRRVRTSATVSGARAYRRMPDDLAATYAESGSVTAVARHYGVPRHTAQGWIGRLRRQH
jgi:hypothetical protein